MKGSDPSKLVFVDEAGANKSMGRSHAWMPRGAVQTDPRPMNWGKNMTMIGAMRLSGWITMGAMFQSANGERFVTWLRRYLVPQLRKGDIVLLDNARPHHHPDVAKVLATVGASVKYLPPYGYELNPIEPGWGLVKKHIRAKAPRSPAALRRVAHHGRRRITPGHCRNWFRHSGYSVQPK